MAPAVGVQNKVLLCLFFPYSSFNSMKNSQDTKQFCLDLTFPVWLQRGERGASGWAHQQPHPCCCVTTTPGHATVAGPDGPGRGSATGEKEQGSSSCTYIHLEGQRHRLSCLAQSELMRTSERNNLVSVLFSPHQVN